MPKSLRQDNDGGNSLGSSEEWICPHCGYKVPHKFGARLFNKRCPNCGLMMMEDEIVSVYKEDLRQLVLMVGH
jgi:predicted RNA-binding Zn-ribbon protein involved in translation (DUF1610 family)